MKSAQSSNTPRGGLARKLGLSIATVAVALVLIELALRTRQYLKHGSFGPMHVFVVDPKTGLELPPPGRVTKHFSINELGFRGPLVERPKPPGRLRLAFLGASTTFCAEATSEEASWPAQVAALVAQKLPAGTVDYVNAGVGGHRLEHMQINLEHRVAPLDPDVIFIYEATNDLGRDSRDLAIEQKVYTTHADRKSWLGELWLTWYLLDKNLLLGSRKQGAGGAVKEVTFEPRELSLKYRARLESLCDSAKARAKIVCLLTFSTQARRGQDPARLTEACNTSFYYMPYMSAELLLDAFDEFNRVTREVAAEKGVLLLDVATAVPGDREHFNDSVHFRDRGCAVFAAAVMEALGEQPRWRQLIGL